MFQRLRRPAARRALLSVCSGAALAVAAFTVSGAVEAPPPPSASDVVVLPHDVVEDAEAWQRFTTQAGAVSAAFASGPQVRTALKTGAAYEPEQLEQGEIAFAALTALQESDFVQELKRETADPGRADAIARRLMDDPASIYQVPGAEQAAGLATARLNAQGRHLAQVGAEVKQAAYDVQHSAWSRQRDRDGKARLALVKKLSSTRYAETPRDAEDLKKVMLAMEHAAEPDFTASNASPVVTRGVALAALAVLGRANDPTQVRAVINEPATRQCFNLAKLNLYQCLAVAGPRYEDIFCLAEHGLKETASCVNESTHARWNEKGWVEARDESLRAPPPVVAEAEPVKKGRGRRSSVHHASGHHPAAHGKRRHRA